MLAQNFMASVDLKITDEEHAALVKVLGMLEREELVHNDDDFLSNDLGTSRFDMSQTVHESDCGTVGCIAGWAYVVSGHKAFPDTPSAVKLRSSCRGKGALAELFFPRPSCLNAVLPAQAASALRNFLTLGEPRWSEVLAAQS